MKYVIIGGLAGGASVAARLRRLDEKLDIELFEKDSYISYDHFSLTDCFDDDMPQRNRHFLHTMNCFAARCNVKIHVNHSLESIDHEKHLICTKDQQSGNIYTTPYDKLLLSTEMKPVIPPYPGIDFKGVFSISNLSDIDNLHEYIQKNPINKIVFMGADYHALEVAELFRKKGKEVSFLISGINILKGFDLSMSSLLHTYLEDQQIELQFKESLSAIIKEHSRLVLLTRSGKRIDADMVIYCTDVMMDESIGEISDLSIDRDNYIQVNEYLQTSDPDVYAIGPGVKMQGSDEPVTTCIKATILKQSRIVATNMLYGNKLVYTKKICASVCHLDKLDLCIAGQSAEDLDQLKIEYEESIIHVMDKKNPASEKPQTTLKIIYGLDGKLYGVQMIGEKIEKQIDIFASILAHNGTIYDLSDYEQACAPFSSLVNTAGFIAENVLNKYVFPIHWDKLEQMRMEDDTYLLDVRSRKEFREHHIPNARNIPLDDLRNSIYDIPSDKKILVYCGIGVKGYIASRMLLQSGFENVYNLNGGFITYMSAVRSLYSDTLRKFGSFV